MTELSPREKALVEVALEAEALLRSGGFSLAHDMAEALRAYDPPKPKVPQIPSWEELDGEIRAKAIHAMALEKWGDTWEAIRTLTSKEAE